MTSEDEPVVLDCAPGSTACRSRSSWLRREAGRSRCSELAAPTRRPVPAAHRRRLGLRCPRQQTLARGRRMELRAAVRARSGCSIDSRCSPETSMWRGPRRCALGTTRADIADILGHLVDKSLVIATRRMGSVRFRLLPDARPVRPERLRRHRTRRRHASPHASHFAELCARGPAAFRGEEQEGWLADGRNANRQPPHRAHWVMEEGDAEAVQTMLGGLGWSWWLAGRGDEGWRWITAGLECAADEPRTHEHRRRSGRATSARPPASSGPQILSYGWEALELARRRRRRGVAGDDVKLLGTSDRHRWRSGDGLTLLEEAAAGGLPDRFLGARDDTRRGGAPI